MFFDGIFIHTLMTSSKTLFNFSSDQIVNVVIGIFKPPHFKQSQRSQFLLETLRMEVLFWRATW